MVEIALFYYGRINEATIEDQLEKASSLNILLGVELKVFEKGL
ncbi:MAG: hypothetical protein ACRC6B_09420 [Fusobacteriaceae bacterium]